MKLSEVKEEAWGCAAHPVPTRIVPDFEALFATLESTGWLVLAPFPEDHRETANGALESKLVKDFKNWTLNNRNLMLNTRRVGQYRWYLTIGAPNKRKPRSREVRK